MEGLAYNPAMAFVTSERRASKLARPSAFGVELRVNPPDPVLEQEIRAVLDASREVIDAGALRTHAELALRASYPMLAISQQHELARRYSGGPVVWYVYRDGRRLRSHGRVDRIALALRQARGECARASAALERADRVLRGAGYATGSNGDRPEASR